MKLPSALKSPLMACALVLLVLGVLISNCHLDIPSADDAEEASKVSRELGSSNPFQNDNGSEIHWRPHPHFSEVCIYADYTTQEQNAIIEVGGMIRSKSATKPIHLKFFPHWPPQGPQGSKSVREYVID